MSIHETNRQARTSQFWTALLEYAKTRTELFVGQKSTKAGGFGTALGRTGLKLGFLTRRYDSTVLIEIDDPDLEKALEIYLHLKQHALAINDAFGDCLDWNQVTDRGACYIRSIEQGGWQSPMDEWPRIHENMIEKVIKLEAAVRPYIASVPA